MLEIRKYPRTRHLQGSRLQAGDEDLDQVPFGDIRGRHVVVEEKVDGANAGVRFDSRGKLHLQSRGHFLTGGYREKHFDLLKQWASAHSATLFDRLGDRYAMFGEWLFAKHTVFYDALPHYFLEFDILDLDSGEFLSTAERRALLEGAPVASVPVLYEGPATTLDDMTAMVRPSLYKSRHWRQALVEACAAEGVAEGQAWRETDGSDFSEGLYVKVEEASRVAERLKWVRASFLNSILDSGTHWLRRPVVPNRLADGVDLFASREPEA
jgi:hypothetical protein